MTTVPSGDTLPSDVPRVHDTLDVPTTAELEKDMPDSLESIVAKLPSNRAVGSDCVPNELIKSAGPGLLSCRKAYLVNGHMARWLPSPNRRDTQGQRAWNTPEECCGQDLCEVLAHQGTPADLERVAL